jgi:predicted transcriptional regulator
MTQSELNALLSLFKTLSDETRLRIIGLLSHEPLRVRDLAERLELTEPTISHHLSNLRERGLVNVNMVGTSHIYALDRRSLERQINLVYRLETIAAAQAAPTPDMSWIDALDLDDADRKTFKDYFSGTRLKSIPTKEKKLLPILEWLAQKFAPGVRYTEREVNAILKEIHPDYARLRRELVETHLLSREGGGGAYWRTPGAGE